VRSGRRIRVGAGSLVVLAVMTQGASAESLPELRLGPDDGVAITIGEGALTSEASVTVTNAGEGDAILDFQLVADGIVTSDIEIKADPPTLTPGQFSFVALTFTATSAEVIGKRTLVVTAAGMVSDEILISIRGPVPWPLAEITTAGPLSVLFTGIVGGIIFGLFLVAGIALGGPSRIGWRLGRAEWTFGESWASNVTVAGAALGLVAAADYVPPTTVSLTGTEIAGLSILFAVVATIAPAVFALFSRRVKVGAVARSEGPVWAFVIACSITIAAVIGQVTTLAIVLLDADYQSPSPLTEAIWVIGLFAALLILLRALRSALEIVEVNAVAPLSSGARARAVGSEPAPWSVL
jgi:hypothetical protein